MLARPALTALTVALLLGACGSAPRSQAPADPRPLLSAPEPARAAVPTATPTGTVTDLGGGRPEGMVWDPVSGLVAIGLRAPDRVALVDPATGAVRTALVYGSARHLETLPGGGLLVPGEDSDLVTTYDLPSMLARSVVQVGRQPHDVAATSDGTLYAADEFGGSVSVLRYGKVVKTFRGLLQPGGAAGDGDVAAVVDVRSRLTHFYRGDREVARLPSGAGPTHALSLGSNGILVTDTTGGRLFRYSIDGIPRQVESFALPGRPYGTAYDAKRGRIFITATERNELVQLALTPTGLRFVHTYPTVRDAYSVAVDGASGRVFVTSEIDSTLQTLDPLP